MKLPINYDKVTRQQRKLAREQYAREQHGLCHHCKEPLSGQPSEGIRNKVVKLSLFPPNFFKWPVHLHHNHQTGMTIGAVHSKCNAVLWQYHHE